MSNPLENLTPDTAGEMRGLKPPEPSIIVRRSLHDELIDRVREMIVTGDLEPGTKVPEQSLAEKFGVSRTPLREALKVLASEGLITLTPNKGATISALTLEDLEEAFPVMGALEALSGEMACARISDDEIAHIRHLHDQMVLHYQAGEMPKYFRFNQEIHNRILDAADNATLSSMYRGLSGQVRRARYVANISKKRWDQAVSEHEEIIVALSARNGEALSEVLKRHLVNKFETVKETIRAASLKS